MEKENIEPSNQALHLTRKDIGHIPLRLSRSRLSVRRAGELSVKCKK
jgi:hypothetical protein